MTRTAEGVWFICRAWPIFDRSADADSIGCIDSSGGGGLAAYQLGSSNLLVVLAMHTI